MKHIFKSILIVLTGVIVSCQNEEQVQSETMSLEDFRPVYNDYIQSWLSEELAQQRTQLAEATDEATKATIARQIEKLEFRQGLGDYLALSSMEAVPDDLVWQDGLDQPEFSDPKAKRGGVLYHSLSSFPPTLRVFGANSNSSFRGFIWDEIMVGLVSLHPVTGKVMPGLAKRWAVSADGRTVYYEIHDDITYSDGTSVQIDDFHRSVFIRVSDYSSSAYYKQFYREQVGQIALHSDTVLSVTLPEPKPLMPWQAAMTTPSPEEFYREYGPDFEERYQWRPVPTTGAYHIQECDFVKGVSIKQTRVADWWADDKKFYRNRYNPDVQNFTVIREESKKLELFKIGKLDYYPITIPEYFYEKSEIPQVFDGYIEKSVFYHNYTQIPRGFFLNLSKEKLKDLNFRLGLQHSMNWAKVINVVHRGDYARLQHFYQGYGDLSHPDIKAREFSVEQARRYFAEAGYTEENGEGYLVNAAGQELSISLTYSQHPYYTKMLKILKEEARKVGLNLYLDAHEGSVSYKIASEKKHEMCFTGWGVSPPFPNYYQFFHSQFAYDSEGNAKPYTNNLNCYANPRMDELAEAARNAKTIEELREASLEAQQLVHDEAIFIPSYALDFYRIAHWRWLKWPQTDEVQFGTPLRDNPYDLYVHWIDEEVKAETIAAKRAGKTFPESVKIYDQYRGGNNE